MSPVRKHKQQRQTNRSSSQSQLVRELFSWWPYVFIVISVAGFAYIFWQQSHR